MGKSVPPHSMMVITPPSKADYTFNNQESNEVPGQSKETMLISGFRLIWEYTLELHVLPRKDGTLSTNGSQNTNSNMVTMEVPSTITWKKEKMLPR